MKFTKLFGVGMLTLSILALNTYGVEQIKSVKVGEKVAGTPLVIPPGAQAPAPFVNTCGDLAGNTALSSTGGTLDGTGTGASNDFGQPANICQFDTEDCSVGGQAVCDANDTGVCDDFSAFCSQTAQDCAGAGVVCIPRTCIATGSGWDANPPGCNAGGAWGFSGNDVILEFTVDTTGDWTFTTCPGYGNPGVGGPAGGISGDSSIAIFDGSGGCIGTVVACNGDGGDLCPGFTSELVNVPLTAGDTYFLLVDGWSAADSGDFNVAYHGPCQNDQECADRDDNRFCSGIAICNQDGSCTYTGDPCLSEEAAGPVCDEVNDVCAPCTASPDPDAVCGNDGDPCNGIEFCNSETGGCEENTDICPGEFCRSGTCKALGNCENSGEVCLTSDDCPAEGQPCLGANSSDTPCWEGSSTLGPDQHCPGDELCISLGDNAFTCEGSDFCGAGAQPVYLTDDSGFFGPAQGFNEFVADDFKLSDTPAGRDIISYEFQMICGNRFGTITGPYDLTMQMWTADAEGFPDAPIAGTTCEFKDIECGDGDLGTPRRTFVGQLICSATPSTTDPDFGQPSSITPLTGGRLRDGGTGTAGGNAPNGVDNWLAYTMTTDSAGFATSGGGTRSQGVRLGSTGGSFWANSDNPPLPPGSGDDGWGLRAFASPGSDFAFSKVCVEIVGPCCIGTQGCDMLSAADCAAVAGTYQGDNTLGTPITCADTLDADGVADLCDNCPEIDNVDQADCDGDDEGDACEANEADQDRDFDGVCNGVDDCPDDGNKASPGQCGCGESDDDADGDGTADCNDECPFDENKTTPDICGCGVSDVGDEDGDGVLDCVDQCRGVDDAIFAPECEGAIPTVSEWGLVILALLLLVAGKVYFGRQRSLV